MDPALRPYGLTTPRTVLRPPRRSDAPYRVARWTHEPEVTRYLTFAPYDDVQTAVRWIEEVLDTWDPGGRMAWMITDPEDDTPMGTIGASITGHRATLGYALSRKRWGQGPMTEVVRAVTTWLLAQPGLHRVDAVTDVANDASGRVLEKVGFEFEGVLRAWAHHPAQADLPVDVRSYSRIREQVAS